MAAGRVPGHREPRAAGTLTSAKVSIATLLDAITALDAAEVVQFHRIIDSQTDRMPTMLSDLLRVARIEMGTLSVSPQPINVAVLVEDARSGFQAGRRGNRLEIDLPRVLADRARMAQVLGNLLSNAASHSEETSPIRLTVARKNHHVVVSVSDEGRGVLLERLPHLFGKFNRSDVDNRGDGHEKSGLGPAICEGIVEAHGGRIRAESDGNRAGRPVHLHPAGGQGSHREKNDEARSPGRRGNRRRWARSRCGCWRWTTTPRPCATCETP